LEYAMFLPAGGAVINNAEYHERELLLFDTKDGTIEMKNTTDTPVTIIVLGGEPYTEPIVVQGPFVMNTQNEISAAYNDFFEGKYGKIQYEQEVQ